jgi:hypothetical protein
LGLLNTKAQRHKGGFYIRVEVKEFREEMPGLALLFVSLCLGGDIYILFLPVLIFHSFGIIKHKGTKALRGILHPG